MTDPSVPVDQPGKGETSLVRRAAEWLVRTHDHDYGLMNAADFERRVHVRMEQFEPFIEALLHLPVDQRMEAMGMVPAVQGINPYDGSELVVTWWEHS